MQKKHYALGRRRGPSPYACAFALCVSTTVIVYNCVLVFILIVTLAATYLAALIFDFMAVAYLTPTLQVINTNFKRRSSMAMTDSREKSDVQKRCMRIAGARNLSLAAI